MAALSARPANVAPTLTLNQDEFRPGDRLHLELDNGSSGCRGPWNVFLVLVPHADKPGSPRIYLPEWNNSRQPAKTNVQLKPGLIDIMDIVVEDNLPPGKHRYELTLEPVDRAQSAITLTRDFQILAQPAKNLEIVVDLAVTNGKSKSLTGFLHGISPLEHRTQIPQAELKALIADLKPAYWRLNNEYVYRTARQSGAAVTVVLGDLLAQGGIQPWKISAGDARQWQSLEQRVRDIIRRARQSGMRADYWDLWNEPDTPSSWGDPSSNSWSMSGMWSRSFARRIPSPGLLRRAPRIIFSGSPPFGKSSLTISPAGKSVSMPSPGMNFIDRKISRRPPGWCGKQPAESLC